MARWKQGEEAVAGVGAVFQDPLGSAQAPHLSDITHVLGRASPMRVCDVSSENAFYCSP